MVHYFLHSCIQIMHDVNNAYNHLTLENYIHHALLMQLLLDLLYTLKRLKDELKNILELKRMYNT